MFRFDIKNELKIEASFRLRFDIVDITSSILTNVGNVFVLGSSDLSSKAGGCC